MLLNTDKQSGFTLVELLIAIAILGSISAVAVKSLYDIVTIRAKQQTIEDSSDSFRSISVYITKSIQEAKSVSILNSNEIRITGNDSCKTIRFLASTGELMLGEVAAPCTPPLTANVVITGRDIKITNFAVSPNGNGVDSVNVDVEAIYKNALSNHPFKFSTTITPRT